MNHPQMQDARPGMHQQMHQQMHPQMQRPQEAQQAHFTVQVRRPSLMGSIYSIIHALAALFAIFLSFRCNQGFDIGSFLGAALCPYIYIIYQFAQAKELCGILG